MNVRLLGLIALVPALFAQRQTTTEFDLNGNALPGPVWTTVRTVGGEQRVMTTTSANGRQTPVESVEDRVIVKTDSRRVIERTVVRYDAEGNPAPPIRVRIEENKAADGGHSMVTTTWRTDLNGSTELSERRTERTDASGSGTAVVEKAGQSGALEAVTRTEMKVGAGRSESHEYRRDLNGGFLEAQREITITTGKAGHTVADTTRFERVSGADFEPTIRTVTRSDELSDGSKHQEVDIYTRFGAQTGSEPRLEQQVRQEERAAPGGGTVRTVSARWDPGASFEKVREIRTEPGKK